MEMETRCSAAAWPLNPDSDWHDQTMQTIEKSAPYKCVSAAALIKMSLACIQLGLIFPESNSIGLSSEKWIENFNSDCSYHQERICVRSFFFNVQILTAAAIARHSRSTYTEWTFLLSTLSLVLLLVVMLILLLLFFIRIEKRRRTHHSYAIYDSFTIRTKWND